MSIELVLARVAEADVDECLFEVSKFNYERCGYPECPNLRSGSIGCFNHGTPKQCDAVCRNGSLCVRTVNDAGNKCGIHGGVSKKDILFLNRFRRSGGVYNENMLHSSILFGFVRFCLYSHRMEALKENDILKSFKEVSLSGKDCGICYTEDNLIEFSCCKQACCKYCSSKWVKTNKSCPFCRASV